MTEPNNPDIYDSREEEVIDQYRHYASIHPEDLAGEYLSRAGRSDREVLPAMEAALESRIEEVEQFFESMVSREELPDGSDR